MKALIEEPPFPQLGFSGGFEVPHVMHGEHQHHEIELNFLLSGTMTYLMNGQTATVSAQRLSLFWAAVPHQVIEVHDVDKFYWFTLPLAWVLRWNLPRETSDRLIHGEMIAATLPNMWDLSFCRQWFDDLQSSDADRSLFAQMEMQARVRRLLWENAQTIPDLRKNKTTILPTGHVQRIAEFIAMNYTRQLPMEEIGRHVGLHPNYAMALFRREYGMSMGQYVVQHRCFHAQRLLLTTQRKVADIALESGFGSVSRFYEAFKAVCRCSPDEFRRRYLGTTI